MSGRSGASSTAPAPVPRSCSMLRATACRQASSLSLRLIAGLIDWRRAPVDALVGRAPLACAPAVCDGCAASTSAPCAWAPAPARAASPRPFSGSIHVGSFGSVCAPAAPPVDEGGVLAPLAARPLPGVAPDPASSSAAGGKSTAPSAGSGEAERSRAAPGNCASSTSHPPCQAPPGIRRASARAAPPGTQGVARTGPNACCQGAPGWSRARSAAMDQRSLGRAHSGQGIRSACLEIAGASPGGTIVNLSHLQAESSVTRGILAYKRRSAPPAEPSRPRPPRANSARAGRCSSCTRANHCPRPASSSARA